MARQVADVQFHATDRQDKYDENLDISVDQIDDGLYLGNLAAARDHKTLENLQITHILTVDLVPLPLTILDRKNIYFEYLKLADVPKEDMITHLPQTNEFIKKAITSGGIILVHCYFGVSRSAAIVIGYVMEKYSLCYDEALALVRSKRRFVSPNIGFVAQLKLFGHMGYRIDKEDPRFKQFRLKMAGQKLKQVKILPQLFADLIKPDPGLVRERPDPVVYRCRKCRRVLAAQRNIIPHLPKQVKVALAKKGIRSQPALNTCSDSGQMLIDKLRSLACQILDNTTERPATISESSEESPGQSHSDNADSDEGPSQGLDGYSEHNLVDASIVSREAEACRLMWFVEPLSWMTGVSGSASGKLHCPKCSNKIGSFSWVMGCRCPCGQKVAPAFYLVPSKVEWSNIVQNVQVTV